MKRAFERRLQRRGHPVLSWMVDNVHMRTDPVGNIKPDKQESTGKVDGVVATTMALDCAIRNGGASDTRTTGSSRRWRVLMRLMLTGLLHFLWVPILAACAINGQ